jgi:hypothetical protein
MVYKVALGQGFLRVRSFSLACIISPMLRTHLHWHAALIRTNERGLGTFQKAMLFTTSGGIRMNASVKIVVLLFKDLSEWVVMVLTGFALFLVECNSGLWWTLKRRFVSHAVKTLTDLKKKILSVVLMDYCGSIRGVFVCQIESLKKIPDFWRKWPRTLRMCSFFRARLKAFFLTDLLVFLLPCDGSFYSGSWSPLMGISDHVQTHHIREHSSERVISPPQRPLPYNAHNTQ